LIFEFQPHLIHRFILKTGFENHFGHHQWPIIGFEILKQRIGDPICILWFTNDALESQCMFCDLQSSRWSSNMCFVIYKRYNRTRIWCFMILE